MKIDRSQTSIFHLQPESFRALAKLITKMTFFYQMLMGMSVAIHQKSHRLLNGANNKYVLIYPTR